MFLIIRHAAMLCRYIKNMTHKLSFCLDFLKFQSFIFGCLLSAGYACCWSWTSPINPALLSHHHPPFFFKPDGQPSESENRQVYRSDGLLSICQTSFTSHLVFYWIRIGGSGLGLSSTCFEDLNENRLQRGHWRPHEIPKIVFPLLKEKEIQTIKKDSRSSKDFRRVGGPKRSFDMDEVWTGGWAEACFESL